MNNFFAPAFLVLASAVLALPGCEPFPVHLDPQSVNGRDGGGAVPTYPAPMRIAAAARPAGDLPNALRGCRRAPQPPPPHPPPLGAAGAAPVQMGGANRAIVSYT